MVTPFQKITLISSILIASAISMPSFAKTEKQCGNSELLVSKKIVGTATYAAENCNKPWLGQNIQMEFNYTENIPEWAFKRAATHFLKRNMNNLKDDSALHQVTALYRPVKKGDVYKLSYVHANQTLTLSLNNRVLGKVKDPQIQQYFVIWLGKTPFSAKLKQQLLN
ncbi:chalcone isomerase family protein [Acinetobacter faecalis]|uniref:chalcone isomerase family protein n=1 Tax=Acinetobacter faecalis TaxID=2665161 RepID=UPI002A91BA0F|nr:chalcone isomerase family protein [Acinetobacter faecalis]MDY6523081.1 chalcone isomerase family protein [Acinetobacter faecalis]